MVRQSELALLALLSERVPVSVGALEFTWHLSAIVRNIKYFLRLPLTSDLEPHHFELPASILSILLGYRVCFSAHDILRVNPKELCLWILLTLSLTVVGSFLKTFPPFGSG